MNKHERPARRLSPWLWLVLFALGAVQIVVLARDYRAQAIAKRSAELEESFRTVSVVLKERLIRFQYGLQGLTGVYLMEDMHPRLDQLRIYAESRELYDSFRGVLGFGFVRRVPNTELAAYGRRRERLDPGFRLKPLPAGYKYDADHSFVVEDIEPRERSEGVPGLIESTEASRVAAFVHARDTGRSTLTKLLPLRQKQVRVPGLLLFSPVYRGFKVPETVEERRRLLTGFTYAPVVIDVLLDSAAKLEAKHLAIRMLELDDGKPSEFYRSPAWASAERSVTFREKINAFERPWVLEGGTLVDLWSTRESFLLNGATLLAILAYAAALYYARRLRQFWSRAGLRVRTLEAWQRAIFEGAGFAIITTDTTGTITAVNQSAVMMLGYGREELLGEKHLSRLHERCSGFQEYGRKGEGAAPWESIEALLAAAATGEVKRSSWIYVRKDGSRFPGQLSVKAIANEAGLPMGYLAIVEDVTDQKKAEAKLVHSAQLASLGEMSGGIAHEINNPLAMIKLKADLMVEELDRGRHDLAQQRAGLVKINEVVDRIAAIVSGLRSFSRDSTREAVRDAAVAGILNDTVSLCRERFKVHGVELRLPPAPDLWVRCRPLQVSQALLNLLNNAFDAVAKRPDPWVEISVTAEGAAVVIAVTDSGHGIPEEIAGRMMQPFFTTKDVGQGTGLGLSISRGLLEDLGGKLYYELHGGHTRFVIELPRAERNGAPGA